MFDRVEIAVKAGRGGDGIVSFRREKFVPLGGPDGGDGGKGGDVVIRATAALASLKAFRRRATYRAGDGADGRGNRKHGRDGGDRELLVPPGTIVLGRTQLGDETPLADLDEDGQRVVVARGGKGGLGNVHFASSTNQVPRIAQKGEAGEEGSVVLELRLIADVGIIGCPNAGKSSLLAKASAARPKIASYPFTTLEPVLGVVMVGRRSFVMAELPGLLADASLGRGLGHDFLRHIMRTKILIHLLDGSSASPVDDMLQVNNELALFDSALAEKKQLVAVNKVDLPSVQEKVAGLGQDLAAAGVAARFVSAVTGEGVAGLMVEALALLEKAGAPGKAARVARDKVFRPRPVGADMNVSRQGDDFLIVAPELERIVSGSDLTDPEVRRQLMGLLAKHGANRLLEKAGAEPGDKVSCGGLEWQW